MRAALEANGVSFDQLSEQERTRVMSALKEMARDASGKPTDGATNANANTDAKAPSANTSASPVPSPDRATANGNANRNGNENKNSNEQKVTRTVKGKKEVVIEIAALKGKGVSRAAVERLQRRATKEAWPRGRFASEMNAATAHPRVTDRLLVFFFVAMPVSFRYD